MITLSIPELKKALTGLGAVVPGHPVIPALENVLFEVDGDSTTLTATDHNTIIRRKIANPALNESIAFGLPYKTLSQIVTKLPGDIIQITITQESSISQVAELKAGKVSAKLAAEFKSNYPVIEVEDDVVFTEIDFTDLQEMLEKCRHSMSDDFLAKYHMTGIHFISSGGQLYAMSTNSHIGAMINFDYPVEINANVTRDVVIAKSLFPVNTNVLIGFSANKMVIKNDHAEFQCRLIEQKFVPMLDMMNKFLAMDGVKEMKVEKAALLKELAILDVFTNKIDHMLVLDVSENKVFFEASDINSSKECNSGLDCRYTHEPIRIGVSSSNLKRMIEPFMTDELNIKLIAPNKPILIQSDNHLAYVMPVMIPN